MEYEMRRLNAGDIFPMVKLISKIGINEFQRCFESPAVKGLLDKLEETKENGEDDFAAKDAIDVIFTSLGVGVALEVANTLLANLPRCEEELFGLLASVTGMAAKKLRTIEIADFMELLIAFVQKEEFRDFFGAATKLWKREK